MIQGEQRKNTGRPGRFAREEPKDEFESKLIDLTRTAHMTAGGRRFRFRATVVVGDKQGRVGVGVAKGIDVSQAIDKATKAAKKKSILVPIKNNTIPHQVEAKYSSARVVLKSQRKGRGLVAGGTVRTICELAGIEDISSKVLSRTKNKLNIARATIKALDKLKAN